MCIIVFFELGIWERLRGAVENAFESIYLSSQTVLLGNFFEEQKIKPKKHLSITENKLFTYWLFKYRLKSSDKSRSASYTKKGINQFQLI